MPDKHAPFQTLTQQLNRLGFPVATIDRVVSVVMSVADEAGNILPLCKEIVTVLDALPSIKDKYEIIFVDDYSVDNTRSDIQEAMNRHPNVRLICHQSRYGKSQGVWTGLRHARGEWIVTMDGDGQNDPADIPRLLGIALENGGQKSVLVSGVRVNRATTKRKQMASRFANWLRRTLLKDNCPDTGCALKVFRRDAYLALPYFDNIHRFEPTLFKLYNHEVIFIPVNDRMRIHGISKYSNFKRATDGLFDLFGVMWLQRRLRARKEHSVEITHITETSQRREQA